MCIKGGEFPILSLSLSRALPAREGEGEQRVSSATRKNLQGGFLIIRPGKAPVEMECCDEISSASSSYPDRPVSHPVGFVRGMGDERPLKLAVIITGFWRTHGICGGEGDGGGGGGCGSGRESERVAAGTGQARLFMIGSEEEQK